MNNGTLKKKGAFRRAIVAGLLGILLFAMGSAGASTGEFAIERSADSWEWIPVLITPDAITQGGMIRVPIEEGDRSFRLRVKSLDRPNPQPTPEGFAWIPGGTYTRGDSKYDTNPWPQVQWFRPAHEVYVSDFFMAETPVTFAQWKDIYAWAIENGYDFSGSGTRGWLAGQGELSETPENSRHPVVRGNWFDALKWCNARSERDGLTPVYYTDEEKADIYRTGEVAIKPNRVDWEANGYRLPTEVEWEKAARGGLEKKRYTWGDQTIDPTRANYASASGVDGTTPVGSYPPNGYGLYDMAGNVWEWCWDWGGEQWYSHIDASAPDSRGPNTGSERIRRGGSWFHGHVYSRVVHRTWNNPDRTGTAGGFRLARNR